MFDASLVAAPDAREALDLQSASARLDTGSLSGVAKALCGAVGICINLKEDQFAVVLVVYLALEVVSTVHYQESNEINHNRNENRD